MSIIPCLHRYGEVNSNFIQLYYYHVEDNLFMREWIKRKGHRKTYGEIQKESISKILREIASDIQTVEFYTIAPDRSQTCPTYRSCLR